ncbi:DUF1499 domain-containing protein [Photobacterium lipolyticum]|uniref:DUF1499 domain-containing protein n=1 Tax=Photobacterium lipolyticum TaxID=266810 RepID=A0A2T3N5C3_9GAMM|nr:DUF1499 domain-containing protein [Photobacterium lipolyticum]PSW07644.1 DUF1499 domain-containing protein [Photobacterium lipolyticum]
MKLQLKKPLFLLASTAILFGCSNADTDNVSFPDRSMQPCREKPNCVSTLDERHEYQLAGFGLTETGINNWNLIEQLALSLPGASLGSQKDGYIRVECRSSIFKFVDDFEVRLQDNRLIVRSESRVGYSDFGVNRKRAELFRSKLSEAGYIKP